MNQRFSNFSRTVFLLSASSLQLSQQSNGVPNTRQKEPRTCGYATLQHYTLPGPESDFSKRFRVKPKNAGTLLLRNSNFQIGITYRTILVRQRSDSNIHRDWGIAVLACISCNLLRANCPGYKILPLIFSSQSPRYNLKNSRISFTSTRRYSNFCSESS